MRPAHCMMHVRNLEPAIDFYGEDTELCWRSWLLGWGDRVGLRTVEGWLTPAELAKAARLRYVTDQDAGIARRKNGSTFPIDLIISEFQDGQRLFTGIVRDITERKLTERSQRRSDERYLALFEYASSEPGPSLVLIVHHDDPLARLGCRSFPRRHDVADPDRVGRAREPVELLQRRGIGRLREVRHGDPDDGRDGDGRHPASTS